MSYIYTYLIIGKYINSNTVYMDMFETKQKQTALSGLMETYKLQQELIKETKSTIKVAFMSGLVIGLSAMFTVMTLIK